MKIRKINKTHIVTAIILSATFLFVGCGIGTTTSKRTIEPDTVEEEISNNKDLIKENDIKEEIQNKNVVGTLPADYAAVAAVYKPCVIENFNAAVDSDLSGEEFEKRFKILPAVKVQISK